MTAAPTSSVNACARFLVELENTCAAYRLYGAAHPAFGRCCDAAAGAVARLPLRVSVAAGGFAAEEAPIAEPALRGLARRLRLMGLVGLDVEAKPTAAHVAALVPLLAGGGEAEVATDAIVERIAQATGNTIRVVPLRLANLRLVRGAAQDHTGKNLARADEPPSWRELLSRACTGGLDEPEVRELAQSFESALGAKPSEAQWNAMVDVWSRQLAHAHAHAQSNATAAQAPATESPQASASSAPSVWDAPAFSGNFSGNFAGGGVGQGEGGGGSDGSHPLDAVGHFLQALSPDLSRRLLSETIQDRHVPEPLVMSLAQRLPTTVVLGALSAVDRDNASPSQAAMALLRKVAAQAGTQGDAKAPRTNEELAATAAALERLLQTSKESAFVPGEYLRRRDELSRAALAPQSKADGCPSSAETARHAAELVLQILAAPQADPSHVLASLQFVAQRMIPWVRAGELSRAAEAAAAARGLGASPDAATASAARSVVGVPLGVDDLHEAARQFASSAAGATHAADAIAGLLRQCDGATLASLLRSNKLKHVARATSVGGEDVVVVAIRAALADAPDHCIKGLFDAVSDKPPPALLAVLDHLGPDAHLKAVAAAVPHCTPPVRKALLAQAFKRGIAWPVELTEHLLKDTDKDVRRMAVMRLVRDADDATCARHLALASGADEYEADVAAWLAELLRPRRKHPDVRAAWRRWTWSKRRWKAILFIKVTFSKRAGKGDGK